MAKVFQYQGKAEPVPLGAGETITLDKWQPPVNLPVRGRRSWLGDSACSFVAVVTAAAPTTFPELYAPQPDPVPITRRVADTPPASPVTTAFPEAVSADRWHPAPNLPVRHVPWRTPVDPTEVLTTVPESVTADRWLVPADLPVRTRARTWLGGSFQAAHGVVVFEAVTADRWISQPVLPVRAVPRRVPVDPAEVLTTSQESVSADRWLVPTVLPVRPVPRRTPVDPAEVLTTLGESITPDKWLPLPDLPIRARAKTWLGAVAFNGDPALYTTESVTVDKWFRETERPVRAGARTWLGWLGQTAPGVVVAEAVSVDRWASVLPIPTPHRWPSAEAPPTYVRVPDPAPVLASIDWLRDLERPTRPVRRVLAPDTPFVATAAVSVDLLSGLGAYYRLDGNLLDASGNNRHLTASGTPTYGAGQLNSALVTQAGTRTPLGIPAGAVSISAWFKGDATCQGRGGTALFTGSLGLSYQRFAGLGGRVLAYADGATQFSSAFGSVADDTWVNAVVTFDGTTARFYVNGTLVDSGPFAAQDLAGLFAVSAFAFEDTSPVDEVGVWGRALNAAEVAALPAWSGPPVITGLVCGTYSVYPTVSGTFSVTSLVSATLSVSPTVSGTLTIEDC